METSAPVREHALQTCDQEAIRIPGSIQPHGALITLDPASLRVLQASANVSAFFGRSAEEVAA